ncbi:HAD family phosphatase [soil metagenome]
MRLEGILFDMDGLLLDSERLYLEASRQAFGEYSFDLQTEAYLECICTPDVQAVEILRAAYGEALPVEQVMARAATLYGERVRAEPVPLKMGCLELLNFLQANDIKRAVVTSTRTEMAEHKLKLAGIREAFAFVVGGDQVERSKPDPAIYRRGVEKLGVPVEACLVLEDSENGVRAAVAAGLRVIQVPDLKAPSDEFLTLGHDVLPSLGAVQAYLAGLEGAHKPQTFNGAPF